MASNIISYLNNSTRLTGLVSGMDTDTLVKQMMAADQAKLDKLIQKRQIDLWKTDAYREITSTFQSFYNEYFDTLSSKNLKSINSFASFSSSYSTTNATNYVAVTPGASAKAGTYTIKSLKAATNATVSGSSVSRPVEGTVALTDADVQNIKVANGNNTFEFTLNNVTKQFTIGSVSTVADLKNELQSKIDAVFGKDAGVSKITVGLTADNRITFSTVRNTDAFSIGTVYNEGADALFGVKPTAESPFVTVPLLNKFDLTIGGVKKTVTLATGQVYTNADDLATAIKAAADEAFGGSADITFTNTDGKVTYTSGQSVSIEKTDSGANAALGLQQGNLSNKIDLTAKIYDIKDAFNNTAFASKIDGSADDITFSINGKFFRFNSKDTSLNDIIKAVNADTTINVKMKYDFTTNSFKIETADTGAASQLIVKDIEPSDGDGLMEALGFNITDTVYGSDASATLSGLGGSSSDVTIVRPSNSFTYDGITFNIKNDFTSGGGVDPINVTVASDTTNVYDYIKTFVDKYNEIVGKLNGKIDEKVNRDYLPLTDEQKASMTEDQIKQWEDKAKSGLLRNDSIISSTLNQMRTALYAAVQGVGISLFSIGITTSSDYTQKGKLEIDEAELKKALATKPEEVANLFTSSSDITYYDAMNNSTLRDQRYKESGIAYKLSDIIQDAIRTSTDNSGNKGSLLEKAGIIGDRSEYSNVLYKEIKDFDSQVTEMNNRLAEKENALYEKFAKMESALSKMNEQQSWITQQFSTGS